MLTIALTPETRPSVLSHGQGFSFQSPIVSTISSTDWTKPSYRIEACSVGGMSRCCGSCSTAQECSARRGGHGLSAVTSPACAA